MLIDFHTLSYTGTLTIKSFSYYTPEAWKTQYPFQVQSSSVLGHYTVSLGLMDLFGHHFSSDLFLYHNP